MVLTGDPIGAAQALDYGLVQWVVPRAELYARAEELARKVIGRPYLEVRRAKESIVRGLNLSLEDGLRLEWLLARELAAAS
jgi:enoyl-CoA hydratase/carnithine racemase